VSLDVSFIVLVFKNLSCQLVSAIQFINPLTVELSSLAQSNKDAGQAILETVLKEQGGHSSGAPGKVREFKSGQGKKEKSGKVCSCIWSITASFDLDTKRAKKELFIRYSCASHEV